MLIKCHYFTCRPNGHYFCLVYCTLLVNLCASSFNKVDTCRRMSFTIMTKTRELLNMTMTSSLNKNCMKTANPWYNYKTTWVNFRLIALWRLIFFLNSSTTGWKDDPIYFFPQFLDFKRPWSLLDTPRLYFLATFFLCCLSIVRQKNEKTF